MSEAEQVYSTQQVADRLGVGAAMLRRYAQTLERIRGQEIPQTRRDGRQFGQDDLRTLLEAKALIDTHHGLGVEAALRMVVEGAEGAVQAPILPSSVMDSAALVEALQTAYSKANEPILAELQALRAEVAKLQQEAGEQRIDRQLSSPDSTGSIGERVARADDEIFYGYRIRDKDHLLEPNDGVLVRFARRLERILWRRS